MLRTGSKKIVVNAFGGSGPEFSDNPVEQSENARKASLRVADLEGYPYKGRNRPDLAKTQEEHETFEDFHHELSRVLHGAISQAHKVAAAHHATAAHVLERHGYNSSDDAAADREF